MSIKKSIGEQLREARKGAKLTQRKLSEISGITEETINRIERQRVIYTYVHTLQQLQKALNIQFTI